MSESSTPNYLDHQRTSGSQNTSCAVIESPKAAPRTNSQLQSPANRENSISMGQCLSADIKRKMSARKQAAPPHSAQLNPPNKSETEGTSLNTMPHQVDDGHNKREKGGIRALVPNVEYVRSLLKLGSEEASENTNFKTDVTRLPSDDRDHDNEEELQRRKETLQQQPQPGMNSIVQVDETIHMQETEEEILPPNKRASKCQQSDQPGGNRCEGSASSASFVGGDAAKIDGVVLDIGTREAAKRSIRYPEVKSTIPPPGMQNDPRMTNDPKKHIDTLESELSAHDGIDFGSGAISTTEEILSSQSQDISEEGGSQHVRSFYENDQSFLENEGRRKLHAGKGLHKLLKNHPSNLAVLSREQFTRNELLDIDTLYPSAIDGPPLCLLTHIKIRNLERLIRMIPMLRTLRLPRIQTENAFNLEEFFSSIAGHSGSLRELVFEDNGAISTTTAGLLFQDQRSEDNESKDRSCFQKVEVYAPKTPILRALATNCCSPSELCFHALTPNLQRDLCQTLHKHGRSLRSLFLGFNLVQEEPATGIQRRFWNGMISFLDVSIPETLSQLRSLEMSSSPLHKMKHRFNKTSSEDKISITEGALLYITNTMEMKNRARHPKEMEISLGNFRLAGDETLVVDALKDLSWVNQDRMGVLIEIPGACAAFHRGYGKVNPVVLQSLQLDQFFFNKVGSEWLGFTSLQEIDLGEPEFVKTYNTGGDSMRKDVRRLLSTSRDSLSKVRAYYQMLSLEDVMNSGAILDEITTLAPYVNHLELSRDVVMHADVSKKEYVDIVMMLRRWNLKTLHLQSAQNYGTVREDRKSHKEDSAKGTFTRFLEGLPAFLIVVAIACPSLENLILEWDDLDTEVNIMETKKLIREVLKALDVYETAVPSVNVATVRCLVQWYSNCVNLASRRAEGV